MKKILILTLGAGARREENECLEALNKGTQDESLPLAYLREHLSIQNPSRHEIHKLLLEYGIWEENEFRYVYGKGRYRLEGQTDTYKTEYIGEYLRKLYQPDEIYVLGTARSKWDNLFIKASMSDQNPSAAEKEEVIKGALALADLLDQCGIHTGGEELKEYQERFEAVFRSSSQPFTRQIHPVLIRYGISEEEMTESYAILSDVFSKVMDEDNSIDLAFDITHSFRSVPLTTLISLNYHRSLADKDKEITISHIYYGNFEVSKETGGITQVVDLKNAADLLAMISAVREYKETGSTNALEKECRGKDQELAETLSSFNWALESNNLNQAVVIMKKLIRSVNEPSGRNETQDAGNMLQTSLQKTLLKDYTEDEIDDALTDIVKMSGLQNRLAEWMFKQKRYGTALVISFEGLKSLFAAVFLNQDPDEGTGQQNPLDGQSRSGAVENFYMKVWKKNPKDYSGIRKWLLEAVNGYESLKPVRNVFAHNYLADMKDEIIDVSTLEAFIGVQKKLLEAAVKPGGLHELMTEANGLASGGRKSRSRKKVLYVCPDHKDSIYKIMCGKSNKQERYALPGQAYASLALPSPYQRMNMETAEKVYATACTLAAYVEKCAEAGLKITNVCIPDINSDALLILMHTLFDHGLRFVSVYHDMKVAGYDHGIPVVSTGFVDCFSAYDDDAIIRFGFQEKPADVSRWGMPKKIMNSHSLPAKGSGKPVYHSHASGGRQQNGLGYSRQGSGNHHFSAK